MPEQTGQYPYLAAVAGKDGRLFLLNRYGMGTPLDEQPAGIERCLCGPSYFQGADGIGRVVTSHGRRGIGYLHTWLVSMWPKPHLVLEGSANIPSGQAPGFFTVISSNGTNADSAIIWAVGRPTEPDTTFVYLYAFKATASGGALTFLFNSAAGNWPNTGGAAFIAPVVANGRVYVASAVRDASGKTLGQLTIFGPLGQNAPQIASKPTLVAAKSERKVVPPELKPSPVAPELDSPHVISGTLRKVDGSTLTLETRTKKTVKIDVSQAIQEQRVTRPLSVGTPFTVKGSSFTASGALLATSVVRAKGSAEEGLWPPDR